MRYLSVLFVLFFTSCGASAEYKRPQYEAPPVQSEYRGEQTVALSAAQEADAGFFGSSRAKKQADVGGSTGGVAPTQPTTPQSIDQKLVKNAWLTIQVKDEKHYPEAIARAEKVAKGLDGYIAAQTRNTITFKIPTGRLDEALTAVGELGKVKHRDVTTVDVTANFVDLQIRIDNLKKVRVRLQELVDQGKNVQEILEVEKELARVTSQLESLEGQMRVLGNQTTFATVNVTFQERVRPGPIGWIFYGLYRGVKWLFVWD